MNTGSRHSARGRNGTLRCLLLLAAAASVAAMVSGCAGGGALSPPPAAVAGLAGVPADHGLRPGDRIAVEPGSAADHGNVTIHCPADTPACVVVVAADGGVGYEPAGGMPAIRPRAPDSETVEDALKSRLAASTWPVASSFGGAVATCEAEGCPRADAIHVDRLADEDVRRPDGNHRLDLSGFDRLEPRRGIALARKATTRDEGRRSVLHRAYGTWMDHGFFLVETFAGHEEFDSRYRVAWFGNASHTAPLAAPGGSATWSGVMSGVTAAESGGSFAFVHGDSAVTVSGLDAGNDVSVDVAFTNIVLEDGGASVADMVWRGLPLQGRTFGTDDVRFNDGDGWYFRDASFGAGAQGSLYGRLYGPGHGEVGGVFHRDGIAGAFAAERER
ncbi:MAG: hypothetical protein OXI15_16475 [Chromatiales bacterium]|nr:hypothetical protein [Chromatiales bacterium]